MHKHVAPPLKAVREEAAVALGAIGTPEAMSRLMESLADENPDVRTSAADALGHIRTPQVVASLRVAMQDQDSGVRSTALGGIVAGSEDEVAKLLLSEDLDGLGAWLDPQQPISADRVGIAAKQLSLQEHEVQRRYERLAEEYGLRLEWRNG